MPATRRRRVRCTRRLRLQRPLCSDAERRIGLLATSLVPKAEQALEVAREEFSAGKADFMTLIDAQRTLLEFRLMRERATADREIAMGDIGCCVGKYRTDPSDPTKNQEEKP
ncbi:MAG TPA: hypothetical protein DCS43_06760 [Verrucomicrobia bacterium]|nr:hypothetical protein [Verrucomicrobiota bacterium]